MLTKIVAQTRNAYTESIIDTILIDVSGQNSEYKLKDVDGLGPVKAEVSSVDLASEAGQEFLYARDSSRNIVITLEFNPNWALGSTTEGLRRRLYDVFMPKTRVELTFTDTIMGEQRIIGYVESHEPIIFSQKPSVQISLLATDPYFRKPVGGVETFYVPDSQIPSFVVPYTGNIPVGFSMECTLTQARTGVTFLFTKLGSEPGAGVTTTWEIGDIYRLQTVPGQKGVRRYRGGVATSILGRFTGSFTPLKLTKGDNHFSFSHASSVTDMKIMYIPVYGGL